MVANRDAKHKRSTREIDAKYIAQGRAMVAEYDRKWEDEVKDMNRGKVGRPFKYAHSMMNFVAMSKVLIGTGYRQCEGVMKASWGDERAPSYSAIWQRAGRTMPRFEKDSTFQPTKDGIIRLVPDSTGIKLGNRGEWIRVRWSVTRGFFKLHILVDLDTRRILAFSLTDMKGGDAAQLHGMLRDVLGKYAGSGVSLPEPIADVVVDSISPNARLDSKQTLMDRWLPDDGEGDESKPESETESKNSAETEASHAETGGTCAQHAAGTDCNCFAQLKKRLKEKGIHIEMRADGGYDTYAVFSFLHDLDVTPIIKVRIDSAPDPDKADSSRAAAVLEQLGGRGGCTMPELRRMRKDERLANQKEWKKDVRFGLRWVVEIVISAFKRVFGESVRARAPYTAYVEIATKIAAYNRNLDIGDAAMRDVGGTAHTGSGELASMNALNRWIAA